MVGGDLLRNGPMSAADGSLQDVLRALKVEFLQKSGEQLSQLAAGLGELAGNPSDLTLAAELYRHAHILTGRGATFGVPAVSALARPLADLLDDIAAGRRAATPDIATAMLEAVDMLRRVTERPDELGEESPEVATAVAALAAAGNA